MASCLGLYIQNNLIKYAKVSKEREDFKVESFGVKFYENLNETIKQIVEETYSYKTPISVNLSEEMYNYFNMFSLLNKKDLQKAITTEFDSYCIDKGYNPNIFESRYAIVENIENKEKLKVIYVSSNKIELNKRIQQLEGYHLINVSPISMGISNLTDFSPKENSIIVNIEDHTTITTILDQKIYDVKVIENGSEEFLNKINTKENSYSKSYEICKETTIYTSEGKDLTDNQATYLEDIMPTLYDIVGEVRKILNGSMQRFDNIYITGTAALINNIDLYFQEYLENVKCQILKPKFINKRSEINIKDYIEVNSAISMALMGLDEGISGMNFKKTSLNDKIPEWMKLEITPSRKTKTKDKEGKKKLIANDFNLPLDKIEVGMIRGAIGLFILFTIYSTFTFLVNQQMDKKKNEAQDLITDTSTQIALVNSDNEKIKAKTNDYTTMIQNLEEINNQLTDRNKTRDAIPNLLNQLMYIMPEGVQITSVQNTTGSKIVINAQSKKYEQLGFLKANIQLEGILLNVISTTGQKENNIVSVKIEGDLP